MSAVATQFDSVTDASALSAARQSAEIPNQSDCAGSSARTSLLADSTPDAPLSFVTLEEQIEQALYQYRQREFHGFLNVIPEGIALCSRDNIIQFSNAALNAMLDQPTPPTGRNLADLIFAADDSARVTMQQNRAAILELPRGRETADGVWRVARYPVNSAAAQPTGSVWTVRNITQQKLADEMRDHFVTAATHELRTPLANIRAYAQTLLTEDDIDLAQEKHFINVIDGEAARLSRFVDDLLDVNQMQAGSLALDRHQVDLQRLVSEVDAKVRPLMEAKSLSFDMVIPPKLPQIHADKDKLSAAIVSLATLLLALLRSQHLLVAIGEYPSISSGLEVHGVPHWVSARTVSCAQSNWRRCLYIERTL